MAAVPNVLLGSLFLSFMVSIIVFVLATLSYDLLTVVILSIVAWSTALHHALLYILAYRKPPSVVQTQTPDGIIFFSAAGIGGTYALVCLWIIALGIAASPGMRSGDPRGNWKQTVEPVAVAIETCITTFVAVYCTMKRGKLKAEERDTIEEDVYFSSLSRGNTTASRS